MLCALCRKKVSEFTFAKVTPQMLLKLSTTNLRVNVRFDILIVFEAKLPHLYMSLIYCIVFIKDNVGQRPFVVKNVIILKISKEHVNGNLN